MKEKRSTKVKERIRFLKSLRIEDFKFENVRDIISLVKSEYGYDYPDKEFYDEDVVKGYIRKMEDLRNGAWRGAFFNGELIGQTFSMIENGVAYVKLAMVKKDYRGMGVMGKLITRMTDGIDNYKKSDFKAGYAFINNNNLKMQKIVEKFQFKLVGSTPSWEKNKLYKIYVRILFDHTWKMIKPYIDLCEEIFKTIKTKKINRLLSINLYRPSIPTSIKKCHIRLIKDIDNFPVKYNLHLNNKLIAVLYENSFNKSWYNFRFLNSDLGLDLKQGIIEDVMEKFYAAENIKSLSFPVDINDKELQAILMHSDFKYYAFLPFFNNGKDEILLGFSKIEE